MGGYLLSKVLPLIIVVMVLVGAFHPAIDITAGERERGTLETTLSAPDGEGVEEPGRGDLDTEAVSAGERMVFGVRNDIHPRVLHSTTRRYHGQATASASDAHVDPPPEIILDIDDALPGLVEQGEADRARVGPR